MCWRCSVLVLLLASVTRSGLVSMSRAGESMSWAGESMSWAGVPMSGFGEEVSPPRLPLVSNSISANPGSQFHMRGTRHSQMLTGLDPPPFQVNLVSNDLPPHPATGYSGSSSPRQLQPSAAADGGQRRSGRKKVNHVVQSPVESVTSGLPRRHRVTEDRAPLATSLGRNFNRSSHSAKSLNTRPIIGIVSQGLSKSLKDLFPAGNYSTYIPASYVQYVEASGARVVPIIPGQSARYYRQLFSYLNGIVFPGGGADLQDSGYAKTARVFWELAAENSQDYFPFLGICLGFELMTVLELKRRLLEPCSAENMALPLNITAAGERSRLFSAAGPELAHIAATQNVTINFHHQCLSEAAFQRDLSDIYTLISTNRDANGLQYISAMEHRSRPVYGLQFHPEKNIFEWGDDAHMNNIPHSGSAVRLSQYIGNFFVSEARRSGHRFPSAAVEQKYLIYNYQPEYTGAKGSSFTECYLFP